MSFFENSNINSFLCNQNTPQKIYLKPKINTSSKNNINNTNNKFQNLFTSRNNNLKAKDINNIFSSNINYQNINNNQIIFSFPNNQSNSPYNNNDNGNISNKIIFEENNKNYSDCSIGTAFRGKNINCNKEKYKMMSITFLPEFTHASNEELRLADFERKKTGNIIYFKIRNTAKANNNYFKNIHLNLNNSIFKNNNNNLEISRNIYTNKINNNNHININSNYNSNAYNNIKQNNLDNSITNQENNTLFTSNIISNQNYNIFSGKVNNFDSPFEKLINRNNIINNENNNNNIPNNSNTQIYDNNTIFSSANLNNQNNSLSYEKIADPFVDIYKLLSKEGKLGQEINNAIQKGQTVKEFMDDLNNKYNNSNKANKNEENMNFSQNSFDALDIFGNYLKNDSDKYDNGIPSLQKNINEKQNDNINLSPIKDNIYPNEVNCFKMDVEYDYDFDYLKSKIDNIYNEYEKYKDSFNIKNISNLQNYKMNSNKINKNNKEINNNDHYFNKTFSNGLPKNKSLLDNSTSLNDQNQSYMYNIDNKKKEVMVGRDEILYQQNLYDINKLGSLDITINSNEDENISNNKNKNDINNQLNNSISQNSYNNISLSESSSTVSRKVVDLVIKYHLPDEENLRINETNDRKYYDLIVNEVNLLNTVKTLKEELKSRIHEELRNKNCQNYIIKKISLLVPMGFLNDKQILLHYKLRKYSYTLQAFITYEKINHNKENITKNELAPKLSKSGYNCIPSLTELSQLTSDELKKIQNFKIYNEFGEVEFKEPVNLIGLNLDEEVEIKKDMIETGDKLNYWSIFKLYNFCVEKGIGDYILKIERAGGKFISYQNKELIWEYKPING